MGTSPWTELICKYKALMPQERHITLQKDRNSFTAGNTACMEETKEEQNSAMNQTSDESDEDAHEEIRRALFYVGRQMKSKKLFTTMVLCTSRTSWYFEWET